MSNDDQNIIATKIGGFLMVPHSVLNDPTISGNARSLFLLMMSKSYGWKFNYAHLGKSLGLSIRSIQTYINELCKAGYLSKEQRIVKGQFSINEYKFLKGYVTEKLPDIQDTADDPEITVGKKSYTAPSATSPSAESCRHSNKDLKQDRLDLRSIHYRDTNNKGDINKHVSLSSTHVLDECLKEVDYHEHEGELLSDEQLVFDYWRTVMKKPRAQLSADRKAKIKKQLKHYSVEDLKLAILGCSLTPFNMGNNGSQTRYTDIELILRDSKHIEEFMFNAKTPPKKIDSKGKAVKRGIPDGHQLQEMLNNHVARDRSGNII